MIKIQISPINSFKLLKIEMEKYTEQQFNTQSILSLEPSIILRKSTVQFSRVKIGNNFETFLNTSQTI